MRSFIISTINKNIFFIFLLYPDEDFFLSGQKNFIIGMTQNFHRDGKKSSSGWRKIAIGMKILLHRDGKIKISNGCLKVPERNS